MNRTKLIVCTVAASVIGAGSGFGAPLQITVTGGGTAPTGQAAPTTTPTAPGPIFHNGGTGDCQGCHTTPPQLIGSDPSSTCLRCHQAPLGSIQPYNQYVATDTRPGAICEQLTPGGDFCWVKKTYTWSQEGSVVQSPGDRHGHNITALDYGYTADGVLTTAPGGTYPSSSLSCISCHDPHGYYRRFADGTIGTSGLPIIASGSYSTSPTPTAKGAVGVYRLLAGKTYRPQSLAGGHAFVADPPTAVAPPTYNRAETDSDTRVAYGSGMSEWCQNCHAQINSSNMHVSGNNALLTQDTVKTYNAYISSGNLNGTNATAYTSMVPYEMRTNDYALLKRTANSDGSVRTGPTEPVNVMCLTCHRAHASGWDSITRWNMESGFIVYNGSYPGKDNRDPAEFAQGRTSAETRKTFYDRPAAMYASFQRSLCCKCHPDD